MRDVDLVVSVIALNGGSLVGKTRLQKTVYLLTRCGLGAPFEFEYHHFGPFSSDLATTTEVAAAEGQIDVSEHRGFHDVPYSIFRTGVNPPDSVSGSSAATVKKQLAAMAEYTAIELELAATLDFLRSRGVSADQIDRVVAELKPLKATSERLKRSHKLLRELALEG